MFCVCDTGGNAVTAYLLQQFKLHAPGGDPAARYIFPMTGIYSSDLFVGRDWDFDRPGTDRPGRRKVPLRNEHTAQQYGSPPQRLLFVPRFTPSPPPYNVPSTGAGIFSTGAEIRPSRPTGISERSGDAAGIIPALPGHMHPHRSSMSLHDSEPYQGYLNTYLPCKPP
jgi:hypothetical protein